MNPKARSAAAARPATSPDSQAVTAAALAASRLGLAPDKSVPQLGSSMKQGKSTFKMHLKSSHANSGHREGFSGHRTLRNGNSRTPQSVPIRKPSTNAAPQSVPQSGPPSAPQPIQHPAPHYKPQPIPQHIPQPIPQNTRKLTPTEPQLSPVISEMSQAAATVALDTLSPARSPPLDGGADWNLQASERRSASLRSTRSAESALSANSIGALSDTEAIRSGFRRLSVSKSNSSEDSVVGDGRSAEQVSEFATDSQPLPKLRRKPPNGSIEAAEPLAPSNVTESGRSRSLTPSGPAAVANGTKKTRQVSQNTGTAAASGSALASALGSASASASGSASFSASAAALPHTSLPNSSTTSLLNSINNYQQPRPSIVHLRTSMRDKKKSSFKKDKPWKHPTANYVTEAQKKRYEGLWGANRGNYVTKEDIYGLPSDDPGDYIHAFVVRDLWSRSGLNNSVLVAIWSLVQPQPYGVLNREQFLVGTWLVDQCLYGKRLPREVDEVVWDSVARFNVKVSTKAFRRRSVAKRVAA